MQQSTKKYILDNYTLGKPLTKEKQKEVISYCNKIFNKSDTITNWLKYLKISYTVSYGGRLVLDGMHLQEIASKYHWCDKGIYGIFEPHTNTLLYIGKTGDNFNNRWNQHRLTLDKKTHHNSLLQEQYNTGQPFMIEPGIYEDYGFRYQALHICSDDIAPEELSLLELYYINALDPLCNKQVKKCTKEELLEIEEYIK